MLAGNAVRTIRDLQEHDLAEEVVRPVRTARCVFLDYEALHRDFPGLFPDPTDGTVRSHMEDWALSGAAVVSSSQVGQTRVNTPIHTLDSEVLAIRPPRYGRSLVIPVSPDGPLGTHRRAEIEDWAFGLLDVKGVGTAPDKEPDHGEYQTGLLPIAEAFDEFLIQRLLAAIFRHAGSSFSVLPLYGVIDLGFAVKSVSGDVYPAAALIRRAHRRLPGGDEILRWGTPGHVLTMEIEMLLRQYGISSTSIFAAMDFDGETVTLTQFERVVHLYDDRLLHSLRRKISTDQHVLLRCVNIQSTAEISLDPPVVTLVDFDHFHEYSRFEDPLLSLVRDRPLLFGGVIRPADPGYLQPRPELTIPWHQWKESNDVEAQAGVRPRSRELYKLDGIRCFSGQLAHRYRVGKLGGQEVLKEIEGFVSQASSRWPRWPNRT